MENNNDKAEQEAIEELMNMTQAELEMVQYDVVHIVCQGKGCKRYTRARDYGIHPIYYHPKMVNEKGQPSR